MKNKVGIAVLSVFATLLLVLLFTCPKADAHREAISNEVELMLSDVLKPTGASGLACLAKSFIKPVATDYVTVSNYGVCSVGSIEWKGKNNVVTVGVLGHVYVLNNRERAYEQLQKLVDEHVPSSIPF